MHDIFQIIWSHIKQSVQGIYFCMFRRKYFIEIERCGENGLEEVEIKK